jgi:hypothetical protein
LETHKEMSKVKSELNNKLIDLQIVKDKCRKELNNAAVSDILKTVSDSKNPEEDIKLIISTLSLDIKNLYLG